MPSFRPVFWFLQLGTHFPSKNHLGCRWSFWITQLVLVDTDIHTHITDYFSTTGANGCSYGVPADMPSTEQAPRMNFLAPNTIQEKKPNWQAEGWGCQDWIKTLQCQTLTVERAQGAAPRTQSWSSLTTCRMKHLKSWRHSAIFKYWLPAVFN